MNCRIFRKTLNQWLREAGAEQQGRPATELLAHARECPACRTRLRAALMLAQSQGRRYFTPPWLAGRIWRAVEAERLPQSSWLAKRLFGRPRVVLRWSALAAALAAALGVGMLLGRHSAAVTVRLTLLAPGASEVFVVGDWNAWRPGTHRLTDPDRDGVWEITVKLVPSREYRYQFLIDGERWLPDPAAPLTIDDGFGGKSSVLQL